MENNYFTPSIEDIRVGYECEICPNLGYENVWIPTVGRCEQNSAKDCNLDELTYDCLIDGHIGIRVPYLTKEQIEAEGWKDKTSYLNINCWSFEKGNRFAVLKVHDLKNPFILQIIVKDPSIEELVFGVPSEHYRFIAPCKDINTFRYICKLLGI